MTLSLCSMNLVPQILLELENSNNILIAGIGGGFDLYAGIPLYLYHHNKGKNVYLASFPFTNVFDPYIENIEDFNDVTKIVTSKTTRPRNDFYFPEKFLVDWLLEEYDIDTGVYTFHRVGPELLKTGYQEIVERQEIDTIVCVDGGNDSLMKGDELGVGTPVEDMTSMIAAHQVGVEKSYLVCLGVTVDYFHGVDDTDNWKALAEAKKAGAFKGLFSLDRNQEPTKAYISLVNYANNELKQHQSIVHNSIVSALLGDFGNVHRTNRTKGSKLRISPVMAQYWCFTLDFMIDRLLYSDEIEGLESLRDVKQHILQFRNKLLE